MDGNDQSPARDSFDADEIARHWAAKCEAIDGIAARVVERCMDIGLPMTRLQGFGFRHAWTFDIMTHGSGPWDAQAHMHLGFLPDGGWVLLGYHHGDYRLVVDKTGPLHPGLRQEFIYDRKRREADVILTLSAEEIWDSICSQMGILAELGPEAIGEIRRRSRYT